jgi:hypothetical protein
MSHAAIELRFFNKQLDFIFVASYSSSRSSCSQISFTYATA